MHFAAHMCDVERFTNTDDMTFIVIKREETVSKTKTTLADKWAKGFTDEQARGRTAKPEQPIPGFPMEYIWHTGPWYDIFDQQIDVIRRDIRRAKAEDRLVIYLSCPISSRGGGYSGTNVDVAKHVEMRAD